MVSPTTWMILFSKTKQSNGQSRDSKEVTTEVKRGRERKAEWKLR